MKKLSTGSEYGSYFYVVKWEDYQHSQTTKWVKVYRKILRVSDYVCASSNQKLSMLSALVLADEQGRFPNNQDWLNISSGAEPFEIDFLLSINYITADIPKLSTEDDRTSLILSSFNKKSTLGFDTFWKIYPRKVAKAKALTAWHKNECEQHLDRICSAVKKCSAGWTDPDFTPHAATWLNGHRWEDEIQTAQDIEANALLAEALR